jgi:5'-nucleotidase
MKFLIVNDDSIDAPGIALLAEAAAELGDVWVVAPDQQCSAMSQRLTIRETMTLAQVHDFPVKVQAAYRLGGTPVDCVKVALELIMPEKPDVVLSGINNGYNVGFDIAYSGTLGAAFEAVRHGIPAIAFSVAADKYLPCARQYIQPILEELLEMKPERGSVWNVNLPAMKEGTAKGVLYDRVVAPTSMYREKYIASVQPDGCAVLTVNGIPTTDEQIPEQTDARAVRDGYISVGKVKCAVLS